MAPFRKYCKWTRKLGVVIVAVTGRRRNDGKVGVVLVFQKVKVKVAGVLCCLDDEPLLCR